MLGLRDHGLIPLPGHRGGLLGSIGGGGGMDVRVGGGRVLSQRHVRVPGNQHCQCA